MDWEDQAIDVFEFIELPNWKFCKKKGDVSLVKHRLFGNNLLKVSGSDPQQNYVQIPQSRGQQFKSLQLHGQYVTMLFQILPEHLFLVHLDLTVFVPAENSKYFIRLSLSNLFDADRKTEDGSLYLAVPTSPDWNWVVLDIPNLLAAYYNFADAQHQIDSFEICSNLIMKGVYTSPYPLSPGNLGLHEQFPCQYVGIPREDKENAEEPREPTQEELEQEEIEQKAAMKAAQQRQKELKKELAMKEQLSPEEFEAWIQARDEKNRVNAEKKEAKKRKQEEEKQRLIDELGPEGYAELLAEQKAKKNVKKQSKLEAKNKKKAKAVKANALREELGEEGYAEYLRAKEEAKNAPPPRVSALNPDPVMKLSGIIGYSSAYAGNVQWTKFSSKLANYSEEFRAGSSHYLFYTSGNSLVAYNPNTQAQQPHLGHCDDITNLTVSYDGAYLATGQAGASPIVFLWDLNNISLPKRINAHMLKELKCLSINASSTLLMTQGLDNSKRDRDLIVIWDISVESPMIVARQLSPFDISNIKFSPIHDFRLISCGKENIRFWRIKNDHIPGASVVLNSHARTSNFTDLEFSMVDGETGPSCQILAGSQNGNLFVIGYDSKVIEDVFQIHQGAINVVSATAGYVITGSEDNSVKVWPADFSEAYLEVKFKSGISAIDIAPDGLSAVIGVSNGSLHLLDMETQECKSIHRSHTDEIISFDVHRESGNIITSSLDSTIRIWASVGYQQLYEFQSPDDIATTVSYHPSQPSFACGFASGTVKIFDEEASAEKYEFIAHDSKVLQVQHSLNGRWMVSLDEEGSATIYDVTRRYQPAKQIFPDIKLGKPGVAFSANSTTLAYVGSQAVHIYDLNILDETPGKVLCRGFNIEKIIPTGNSFTVLARGIDPKLKWYTIENGAFVQCHELSGFPRNKPGVEYTINPEQTLLVTGASSGVISVHEIGYPDVQSFDAHTYPIKSLAFTPDGSKLLSIAEKSQEFYIWDFFATPPIVEEEAKTKEDTAETKEKGKKKSKKDKDKKDKGKKKKEKKNKDLGESSSIAEEKPKEKKDKDKKKNKKDKDKKKKEKKNK